MKAIARPGSPVSIDEMIDQHAEHLVYIDRALALDLDPDMTEKWRRRRDIDEAAIILLQKIQVKNPGLSVKPLPTGDHPEDAATVAATGPGLA